MVIGGLMIRSFFSRTLFMNLYIVNAKEDADVSFLREEILKYVHDLFIKNFNNIEIYYNQLFSLSP